MGVRSFQKLALHYTRMLTGTTAGEKQSTVHDDPDEVDISSHPYTPASTSRNQSGTGTPAQQNPFGFPPQNGGDGAAGDPMMQMMQQMMGNLGGGQGGGADPNDPNAPQQQLPPLLQAMMGGGMQAQAPTSGSAYLWRIAHAIFAFMLAGYITLTSTFNGSLLARSQSVYQDETYGFGPRLFWIFATAELVLQSSRFFVEKGQLQGSGWMAMIANSGFVPPPWNQYVRMVGRYSVIYTTVVSDAMVILFVLGIMAWWNGLAAA